LFDTAQHAEAAKSNLAKAGFSTDDMSIVSGSELPKSGNALREPGLWHRLFGGEIEQHEAEVYGKAVETGGVVLTVRAEDAEVVPRAMGILNQHNMVDVQERALQQSRRRSWWVRPVPIASKLSTTQYVQQVEVERVPSTTSTRKP
jgi:hypothetical protein